MWLFRPLTLLLPNSAEVCEMVSVPVCILPSLVSVESMSWRQFLPLPHSLLVHYLTHPLARLALEILFIALSGFSSAGPIRSISAPFEERITNISPLQPQTPPCSVASMNPFDVPRWICVQMFFLSIYVFFSFAMFGRGFCAVWYIALSLWKFKRTRV